MRVLFVLALLARIAHAECAHDKQLPVARGTHRRRRRPRRSGVADRVLRERLRAAVAEVRRQARRTRSRSRSRSTRRRSTSARACGRRPARSTTRSPSATTPQQAERFIVSIDPSHTRRLAYSFAVTARGVRADWIHTDDNEYDRDMSWDPVWIAKATILARRLVGRDGDPAVAAAPAARAGRRAGASTSTGTSRTERGRVLGAGAARSHGVGELLRRADRAAAGDAGSQPRAAAVRGERGLGRRIAERAARAALGPQLRCRPRSEVSSASRTDRRPARSTPISARSTPIRRSSTSPRTRCSCPNGGRSSSRTTRCSATRSASTSTAGASAACRSSSPRPIRSRSRATVRILGALAAGGYVASRTQIAVLGAVTDQATADAIVAGTRQPLVVAPLSAWGAGRVEQQVGASVFGATATAVEPRPRRHRPRVPARVERVRRRRRREAAHRGRHLRARLLRRRPATSTAAPPRSPRSRRRPRTTSSAPTSRTSTSIRRRTSCSAGTPARTARSARACGAAARTSTSNRRASSSTTSAR